MKETVSNSCSLIKMVAADVFVLHLYIIIIICREIGTAVVSVNSFSQHVANLVAGRNKLQEYTV